MNRPDKAGEPSMEEILASIRQIIADEPSTDRPERAIEANPLVPQSLTSNSPSNMRVPLADRLSGVLKNGTLPPTSPLGSKRPLSFDQDLADMFDEPDALNGSAVAAPKPAEIRVPPSSPATASFSGGETPATSTMDGAAALPPQLAPSQPFVPPHPFGNAEKAAEGPPPPTTFGFPPLRKASFYPPQPKAPVTPPATATDPLPSAAASAPAAASPMADATPARGEAAFKRLGSTLPQDDAGAGATYSPGPSEAQATAGAFAVSDVAFEPLAVHGEAEAVPSASFAPATSFAPAAPMRHEIHNSEAGQTYSAPPNPFGNFGQRPDDPMPAPQMESRPIEPRSYPDPFAGNAGSFAGNAGSFASNAGPAPSYTAGAFAAEPDTTSTVSAHQALDAMAQGLAASAAASAVSPEAVSPAIPLTPVIDVLHELRASPAPSTLPAPISTAGSAPANRTLEDAVADMLRPMLQQWVADNMPRIIERALRTEVATQKTKPGQKPSGS